MVDVKLTCDLPLTGRPAGDPRIVIVVELARNKRAKPEQALCWGLAVGGGQGLRTVRKDTSLLFLRVAAYAADRHVSQLLIKPRVASWRE